MCSPALLFGVAPAASATGVGTAGLFGASGVFGLGATLSTFGTLFSAYNLFTGGQDQSALYEARADQERARARDAIERGKIEEDRHRRQVASLKGEQRSQLAASGVELDSGSASDLQADTAMLGEFEALTIRNNAEREAYGYRSAASTYGYQADQAKTSGTRGAMGALLGGLGGTLVDSKWYDSKSMIKPGAPMNTSTGGAVTGSASNGMLI